MPNFEKDKVLYRQADEKLFEIEKVGDAKGGIGAYNLKAKDGEQEKCTDEDICDGWPAQPNSAKFVDLDGGDDRKPNSPAPVSGGTAITRTHPTHGAVMHDEETE